MPPARRRPPSPAAERTSLPGAASSSDRRPLCLTPKVITSPHNEKLKEVRRLQRRRERRFVAEGEDLLAAAAGRLAGGLQLPPASTSRPSCSTASRAGLGHPRARRLRAALGRGRPARCASRCGACATPATSARCCAARWPSAPRRSNWARDRRPVRPQGGARFQWARSSRCPSRGSRASRSSLRRGSRWWPARTSRAGPAAGTLVVGAERADLPREVVEACEAVAHSRSRATR